MATQRGLRGFTRVDALVVGAACLVLVLLVPVLLAKPRERSSRTVCASNLAQVGKIMFVYAVDNEGVLPRAGGPNTVWGPVINWTGMTRHMAFRLGADGTGGMAAISSSLYLLVKYYQAPPRLFVCPGDKGTTEFTLSSAGLTNNVKLSDLWNFGPTSVAYRSCSFAYHSPFNLYFLTTSRDPNLAVAADRNPWLQSPAGAASTFSEFLPDISPYAGDADTARVGNSGSHLKEGQNVLFLDGRVTFETRAYCGLDQDNIYTVTNSFLKGSPRGVTLTIANAMPFHERDSILVHDPNFFPDTAYPSRRVGGLLREGVRE